MPMEKEKSRRFWIQQAPRSASGGCHARDEPVIANLFIFLPCTAEDALFAI